MDKVHLPALPKDPHSATKHLLDKILNDIHPQIIRTRKLLDKWAGTEEDTTNIDNVYTLCLSQINKCLLHLLEIFRLEYNNRTFLQESRQCTIERLSWCLNRLESLEQYLQRNKDDCNNDDTSDSLFNVTVMYFVNWIDNAFDVLNKLSELVYNTDCKEHEELYEVWKSDVVSVAAALHGGVDELLLAAMTLSRCCLQPDQRVLKARSQVVLRETKALVTELVGDGPLTTSSLRVPLNPSNISVMINVLNNALYTLETNTNTALLSLLIHCFTHIKSPVTELREHFMAATDGVCPCEGVGKGTGDVTEECECVKAFDSYNDRLLQIGSFAVSCSSDQNRVVVVRSALASLEGLEPHLVLAVATAPRGVHATLLARVWEKEVQDVRDNVFLIVDPAAFTQRCQQMMHSQLLLVLHSVQYDNTLVCDVINMADTLHHFLRLYESHEPAALTHTDDLGVLLQQLQRAATECKVVSNHLCSEKDHKYEVKATPHSPSITDLHKRLKLLYTLVTRIHKLLQPPEDCLEDEPEIDDRTQTIERNPHTYTKSPAKAAGRSMFVRTNIQCSTRNFPLSKLTKHLHGKNCLQLNFTVELDRLLEDNCDFNNGHLKGSGKESVCNAVKNRSSMRKAVLSRHVPRGKLDDGTNVLEKDGTALLNQNDSLQLTAVLNDMCNMTSFVPRTRQHSHTMFNKKHRSTFTKNSDNVIPPNTNNLSLNVISTSDNTNNGSLNVNNPSANVNKSSMNVNNPSVNVNKSSVNVNNPSVNVNKSSVNVNKSSMNVNNSSDNTNNLSEVINNLSVNVNCTSEVTNNLSDVTNNLSEMTNNFSMNVNCTSEIANNLSDATNNLSDVTNNLSEMTNNFSMNVNCTSEIANNLSDATNNLSDVTNNLSEMTNNFSMNVNCTSEITNNLSDVTNNLSDVTNNLSDVTNNLSDVTNNLSDVTNNLSDVTNNLSDVANNLSEVTNNLSEMINTSERVTIAPESASSSVSGVGTLERVRDLHYVEDKLNTLRSQLETSL